MFGRLLTRLGAGVLMAVAGCAYHWGGPAGRGAGPVLVQVPTVANLSGVPGLDERFLKVFLEAAREYPDVRVAAGSGGLPIAVVVKSAVTDTLVRGGLDEVIEARRRVLADVSVGGGPAVAVDTGALSAGQGLDLKRRPGTASGAERESLLSLARAVLDIISNGQAINHQAQDFQTVRP